MDDTSKKPENENPPVVTSDSSVHKPRRSCVRSASYALMFSPGMMTNPTSSLTRIRSPHPSPFPLSALSPTPTIPEKKPDLNSSTSRRNFRSPPAKKLAPRDDRVVLFEGELTASVRDRWWLPQPDETAEMYNGRMDLLLRNFSELAPSEEQLESAREHDIYGRLVGMTNSKSPSKKPTSGKKATIVVPPPVSPSVEKQPKVENAPTPPAAIKMPLQLTPADPGCSGATRRSFAPLSMKSYRETSTGMTCVAKSPMRKPIDVHSMKVGGVRRPNGLDATKEKEGPTEPITKESRTGLALADEEERTGLASVDEPPALIGRAGQSETDVKNELLKTSERRPARQAKSKWHERMKAIEAGADWPPPAECVMDMLYSGEKRTAPIGTREWFAEEYVALSQGTKEGSASAPSLRELLVLLEDMDDDEEANGKQVKSEASCFSEAPNEWTHGGSDLGVRVLANVDALAALVSVHFGARPVSAPTMSAEKARDECSSLENGLAPMCEVCTTKLVGDDTETCLARLCSACLDPIRLLSERPQFCKRAMKCRQGSNCEKPTRETCKPCWFWLCISKSERREHVLLNGSMNDEQWEDCDMDLPEPIDLPRNKGCRIKHVSRRSLYAATGLPIATFPHPPASSNGSGDFPALSALPSVVKRHLVHEENAYLLDELPVTAQSHENGEKSKTKQAKRAKNE